MVPSKWKEILSRRSRRKGLRFRGSFGGIVLPLQSFCEPTILRRVAQAPGFYKLRRGAGPGSSSPKALNFAVDGKRETVSNRDSPRTRLGLSNGLLTLWIHSRQGTKREQFGACELSRAGSQVGN